MARWEGQKGVPNGGLEAGDPKITRNPGFWDFDMDFKRGNPVFAQNRVFEGPGPENGGFGRFWGSGPENRGFWPFWGVWAGGTPKIGVFGHFGGVPGLTGHFCYSTGPILGGPGGSQGP